MKVDSARALSSAMRILSKHALPEDFSVGLCLENTADKMDDLRDCLVEVCVKHYGKQENWPEKALIAIYGTDEGNKNA